MKRLNCWDGARCEIDSMYSEYQYVCMYILECIDHMLTETNLDQSSCIIAWVHVSCRILHEMMRCADARRSLSGKEYLCIY